MSKEDVAYFLACYKCTQPSLITVCIATLRALPASPNEADTGTTPWA
jgi:hypothetical protein